MTAITTQTKPGFTPGPWVASKFGTQVLTGDSWSTICVLGDAPEWEDQRGKRELEYAWERKEANAHLIAAAPALYEALEPFANVYEETCDDERDDRSLWDHAAAMGITIGDLRAAAAALRLARGEG